MYCVSLLNGGPPVSGHLLTLMRVSLATCKTKTLYENICNRSNKTFLISDTHPDQALYEHWVNILQLICFY